MGSGASTALSQAKESTQADLQKAFQTLSPESQQKVREALEKSDPGAREAEAKPTALELSVPGAHDAEAKPTESGSAAAKPDICDDGSFSPAKRGTAAAAIEFGTDVSSASTCRPATLLSSFWKERLGQAAQSHIPIIGSDSVCVTNRSHKRFADKGQFKPWLNKMVFSVCGQNWTIDTFLGAGGFGQSYLAVHEATGIRYVLKFLGTDTDPELRFLKEAPSKVFEHPNIVSYAGVITDIWKQPHFGKARHVVFMEAIPNGEVFDLITADAAPLSDGTVRRMVHDVINGLAELCKHGITHRDLKPENLLIDENGHIVLIDLGSAKLHKWLESDKECTEEEEQASPSKESKSAIDRSASFMRIQTVAQGTAEYSPPEHYTDPAKRILGPKKTYDSERADVFRTGILVFLLKTPLPPFHEYFGGLGVLTDSGVPESWWRKPEFTNFEGQDDLKELISCLWRLDPSKRPTFHQLQAAIAGDASVLSDFPSLRWLSGPLSEPSEFVSELRAHHQKLSLKCTGVVEALALYVRSFTDGGAEAAFRAANSSSSGQLTASELGAALVKGNSAVTAESAAELMRRYIGDKARDMTLDQFKKMVQDWRFGGRPIVHDVGRMNSRHFAWMPPAGSDRGLENFAKEAEGAFQRAKHVTSKVEAEAGESDEEDEPEDVISFTVSMASNLCQLRVNVFMMDGKLILESRRLWGSSIEELLMLQEMNNDLVGVWGARVEPPDSLMMSA